MSWEAWTPTQVLGLAAIVALVAFAGCIGLDEDPLEEAETEENEFEPPASADDVVVIAVLDWQLDPYHWDYLADYMPQHQDNDPSNDLPLDQDPSLWLPGFPDPSEFTSYEALNLTLTPENPDADPDELHEQDEDEWEKMEQTTGDEVHYRYVPGTKAIGFITTADRDGYASDSHGVGASSVSVGNLHGTCPSCLLVFVDLPQPAGEQWVREQDWIDATTHSYEGSIVGGPVRDSVTDCDTDLRQEAVERGQQIFWAAGNGLANTFTAPQTTLASCEKGPEWTVTVGAIHPNTEASYTGHGKPVHVSNVGQSYPSAGGDSVSDEGSFGGTSSATPTTTGLYAQALHELRALTDGDERVQEDGVILEGEASCGDANPDCPMQDGELTVHELRTALFHAAEHTGQQFHPSAFLPEAIPVGGTEETMLWTQGYGSFLGHLGDWEAQVGAIVDVATGEAAAEVDEDVLDWMRAYSWCSQQVWGTWEHGAWEPGEEVPEPAPDWPLRTWMSSDSCPGTVEALLAAHNAVGTDLPVPVTAG